MQYLSQDWWDWDITTFTEHYSFPKQALINKKMLLFSHNVSERDFWCSRIMPNLP